MTLPQVTVLDVEGRPAPQGSKRRTRHGGLVEMSRHLPAWRAAVHAAATPRDGQPCPPDHAVLVHAVVYVARPLAHYRRRKGAIVALRPDAPAHPVTRGTGDADKHGRAICDALTYNARDSLGLYPDDSQVVDCHVVKRYADPLAGRPTGARITVTTHPNTVPEEP